MKIKKILFAETQEFDETGTVVLFDGYRVEVLTEKGLERITHRYQISDKGINPINAIERCISNAIQTEIDKQ